MKIKILHNNDSSAYDKLSATYGSVFNSADWLKMYADQLTLMGIYNDNENLIGSFFYYRSTKFGLPYIVNPPFAPHNGLFFVNPSQNKSNQNTFEKNVMELVSDFFKSISAVFLVTALPVGFKDTQPFLWKKFAVQPKYTYRVDLLQPENVLLENLTSEKRKSLNKAQKDGLIIKASDDIKVVSELVMKTFARQNKKVNIHLLNKILFEFAKPENSISFTAYENNKPIAASFCIHDKTTAYYIIGGYDSENKHHGAGVSTMWNCMLKAQSIGLKTFDFEGSMLPDVEKYFREFGGTMVPYFAITKAPALVEFVLKLVKGTLT
ncbi:MAG: GNAT family N-acetyltransferase [Bacteroidia bacterium]|nr:GNAT family N-acetyltransferase [Bacteroidia bacterium]